MRMEVSQGLWSAIGQEMKGKWRPLNSVVIGVLRIAGSHRFQIFFCSPICIQSYILEYCDRADFICAIFAWQIEYVDHWPERLGAAHATGPSGWASRVWGKQRVTEMSDVGS